MREATEWPINMGSCHHCMTCVGGRELSLFSRPHQWSLCSWQITHHRWSLPDTGGHKTTHLITHNMGLGIKTMEGIPLFMHTHFVSECSNVHIKLPKKKSIWMSLCIVKFSHAPTWSSPKTLFFIKTLSLMASVLVWFSILTINKGFLSTL